MSKLRKHLDACTPKEIQEECKFHRVGPIRHWESHRIGPSRDCESCRFWDSKSYCCYFMKEDMKRAPMNWFAFMPRFSKINNYEPIQEWTMAEIKAECSYAPNCKACSLFHNGECSAVPMQSLRAPATWWMDAPPTLSEAESNLLKTLQKWGMQAIRRDNRGELLFWANEKFLELNDILFPPVSLDSLEAAKDIEAARDPFDVIRLILTSYFVDHGIGSLAPHRIFSDKMILRKIFLPGVTSTEWVLLSDLFGKEKNA